MKRTRAAAVNSGLSSRSFHPSVEEIRSKKRAKRADGRSGMSTPGVSSPIHSPISASRNTIGEARREKQIVKLGDVCSLSSKRFNLIKMPDDVLMEIVSFIVTPSAMDNASFSGLQSTCTRMRTLMNSPTTWNKVPIIFKCGRLNVDAFAIIKKKSQGTEGTCYQAFFRKEQRMVALKKARVYPDNEGVPYYMMRELSALQKLKHGNICALESANLHNYKLHLIFPYIEKTLHDFVNPGGGEEYLALPPRHIRCIMSQLLSAVSYCHERGIMHRNLKPKHLLIIPGLNREDPLDGCTVKLADFALVRVLVHPPRQYTTEVITLWYRPPEILMGQRNYTTAVDIWSVGCIFAEIMQGRPLFMGLCEIDQLFQIFSKLGTPAAEEWPRFEHLPNFQDTMFPRWGVNMLRTLLTKAGDKEIDLMGKLLKYDPDSRATALHALSHPYFADSTHSTSMSKSMTPVVPRSALQSVTATKLPQPRYIPDMSALLSAGLSISSANVLNQYFFLRELEDDQLYQRPYFKRSNPKVESDTSFPELELCPNRMETVDALVEIMDTIPMHMCTRTVFFAVAILDRYLSLFDGPEQYVADYELIGSTCLHIASKCEDVSYISVKDLAAASQSIPDGAAILRREEIVLNVLNFDLYIPTVIDFVGFFLECIPELKENKKISVCAEYLAEASLMFPGFLEYPPSLLATAIVSYALILCGLPPWPLRLEAISSYSKQHVRIVILRINQMHQRMPYIEYHSTYERFSIRDEPVARIIAPTLQYRAVRQTFGLEL